jgi:hypothetical protein
LEAFRLEEEGASDGAASETSGAAVAMSFRLAAEVAAAVVATAQAPQ